ncbi:MAG: LamG domain-containing protein, partial [Paludibacter sp.]
MKKIILYFVALLAATTISAQIGGSALQLDGANDYVNCGNGSNFNITGTAITIEAWIYTKNINQNWQAIAGKQTHASGVFALIIDSDTKKPALWLNLGSLWNQRVLANTAIEQDKWYHIAGTYDGTTAKIYIDGKLDNSQACSGSLPDALSEPFYIGMNNNVYFNGKIDEVRLWNTTRTEAEIKANMYKEIGTHANLKGYYKMSDGSGTTLTDNSGNNNTGTLTNGPSWKMSGAFAGPRQALDFDGSNDYVDCGNTMTTNLAGTHNFSVEAWAYLTASDGYFKTIIGNYGGHSDLQFLLRIDGGIPRFFISNSLGTFTYLQINKSMPLNTWTHYAGTWDGTTMNFYMNGKLEKTGSLSGSFPSMSNSVKIG